MGTHDVLPLHVGITSWVVFSTCDTCRVTFTSAPPPNAFSYQNAFLYAYHYQSTNQNAFSYAYHYRSTNQMPPLLSHSVLSHAPFSNSCQILYRNHAQLSHACFKIQTQIIFLFNFFSLYCTFINIFI